MAPVNGGVVEWGRDKARELFFYLLFEGPARAEQIVADLWPSLSASRGRALLYSATYALRRAVHADVLAIVNREYQLNRDLIGRHDLDDFDRLMAEADRAADDGERIRILNAAAELADGRVLEAIDGAWVTGRRRAHELRYVSLLTQLATAHTKREEWRAGLSAALRALELDPRADLCALAVRAYLRLDDPANAARLLREHTALIAEADIADRRQLELLARELVRMRR